MLLALLQTTQSGTLYVYQGKEIGFAAHWPIEEYKNVATQNYCHRRVPNSEVDMSDVLDGFRRKARDHARMPTRVSHLNHEECNSTDTRRWPHRGTAPQTQGARE